MPYDFGPEEAIAYLTENGMPPHVAAAFAGNFAVESGFDPSINEIEPTVPGSRGGFGIYQATGPRRVAMEDFLQQNKRGLADPYGQLDFLLHELETTERRARDAIMGAEDVDQAARLVSERFLRPGIPHLDRRINEARKYAGLEPLRDGPTMERSRLGSPLGIRRPPRPPEEEAKEYEDNFLGRLSEKRDTMRAGLGDKLGLNDKQMSGIGGGLGALGEYLLAGDF